METKVLVHGSGHTAASWDRMISYLPGGEDIVCPNLRSLLGKKEACYGNLYASFAEYCGEIKGNLYLCGLSLGGILALNYALDHPQKVQTLILIGTPHKIPRAAFALQNILFRFLPESVFRDMAFDKKNTFLLGNSMKRLDFSSRLSGVQCPTLVLCGEKDRANLKSAHVLSQTIPNAEWKVVEHTGHVVNEENPEALAEILTEYYLAHGPSYGADAPLAGAGPSLGRRGRD